MIICILLSRLVLFCAYCYFNDTFLYPLWWISGILNKQQYERISSKPETLTTNFLLRERERRDKKKSSNHSNVGNFFPHVNKI
jgi:hypothetical protein